MKKIPHPEYKSQITFGNWLTIAGMILGGAGVALMFFTQLAQAEERIKQLEGRFDRHESRVVYHIESVHQDVREIRRAIMRIEERGE